MSHLPGRAAGILLGLLLLAPCPAPAEPQAALGALAYTVVGTPPAGRLLVPPLDPDRNLLLGHVRPFPDRKVPPVFWYEAPGMGYALVRQQTRAPLVVLIAGTGGSFNSDASRALARLLYSRGYHVLSLPSPTHPSFIVNASTTGVPGRMADDARDLYRAMRLAWAQVRHRIEVSAIHLAGFSLGGTQAAWVARLDEQERAIGFERVVLLNPAVSLYHSVNILDAMYDRRVPNEPEARQALVDRVLASFAEVYAREQQTSFDGDFLYRAHAALQPGIEALEMLIGTAFRFALVNLAFTADVISRSGYMVAPDAALTAATSLTNLYKHAFAKSFIDYFDQLYLPYFQARDPSLTRARAIFEAGLLPLEGWLRANPRLGAIVNRDDFILTPEEAAWLERTFGARAVVLPDGGHGGNHLRRDFADALVRLLGG